MHGHGALKDTNARRALPCCTCYFKFSTHGLLASSCTSQHSWIWSNFWHWWTRIIPSLLKIHWKNLVTAVIVLGKKPNRVQWRVFKRLPLLLTGIIIIIVIIISGSYRISSSDLVSVSVSFFSAPCMHAMKLILDHFLNPSRKMNPRLFISR